jgi:streptogramin lyase
VGPAKWPAFKAAIDATIALGTTGPATAAFLTAPVTSVMDGVVLAPNGFIYGIPYGSDVIIKIDPTTDTISSFGAGLVGPGGYPGGVLGLNGKIYAVPEFSSSSILEIDPATDGIRLIPITGFNMVGCARAFQGTAVAPNGKIYGLPACSDKVLEYDPATDTYQLIGGVPAGTWRWVRAILAPNGKIYGMPQNASDVAVIDPATSTLSLIPLGASGRACGATLAPNGLIYGFDCNGTTNVVVINPANDTAAITNPLASANNGWSSVLGPDGNIYNTTSFAKVMKFDTGTSAITYLAGAPAPAYSEGMVLAPNGKIYFAPYSTNQVMVVDPHAVANFPLDLLLSPYLNGSH